MQSIAKHLTTGKSCKSKKRFKDRNQAINSRRIINKVNNKVSMRVYHCEHCGGYHLANDAKRDYVGGDFARNL